MKRIMIVGTAGSGKTSLAKSLSQKLLLPHYELDSFYWLPNWQIRPHNEFKKLVQETIAKDKWIICGDNTELRAITWAKTDTVIWLDYSFCRCFWQALKRSLINIIKHRPCCNGNYESFSRLLFSKNSILLWVIKGYRKKKKRYPLLIKDPAYKYITFIHLRSPKETKKWLETL